MKENGIVKRNIKKNDIFRINKVKNRARSRCQNKAPNNKTQEEEITFEQTQIPLEPGNYMEQEILECINESQEINKEITPEESTKKSNYLNKKISRSISKASKNKKKKIISILKDDFSFQNLKNAIIQMSKELNLEFNTMQGKENFIRKNLKFFEEIYNKDANTLYLVISEQFNKLLK